MIRSIFLAKIDPSIRDHITDMKYTRFREVAVRADELWFNHKNQQKLKVMKVMDDSIAKAVPEPTVDTDVVNQVTQSPVDDYCYYHRVWGSQAKNCRSPCKAKKSPPKNGPRQRRN